MLPSGASFAESFLRQSGAPIATFSAMVPTSVAKTSPVPQTRYRYDGWVQDADLVFIGAFL
jgi:hypothetical protein